MWYCLGVAPGNVPRFMIINGKTTEHCEIRARDGSVGKVRDLYFDDQHWQVRYLVVDTGTWLAGRTVLIPPHVITSRDWHQSSLGVNLTKEQVRNSPDVDTQRPVSRQYEASLHEYYGWPYYWAAPAAAAGIAEPTVPMVTPLSAAPRALPGDPRATAGEPMRSEGDPHLRSLHAVKGSHLAATDGSVGHVEDFLFEDGAWTLRYMIVDTRNWLPGKTVAVPVSAVSDIDWLESKVRVDLTREAIKNGPEFNEARPVPSDYTDRLNAHFGRRGGSTARRQS